MVACRKPRLTALTAGIQARPARAGLAREVAGANPPEPGPLRDVAQGLLWPGPGPARSRRHAREIPRSGSRSRRPCRTWSCCVSWIPRAAARRAAVARCSTSRNRNRHRNRNGVAIAIALLRCRCFAPPRRRLRFCEDAKAKNRGFAAEEKSAGSVTRLEP